MVTLRGELKIGLISLAVAVAPLTALADVVVNEALVNEPGSARNLEWFELYVDSDESVTLSDYRVVIGEDTVAFSRAMIIPPHFYVVVCRKLVSTDGASFEGRWGDSSGVWGDTGEEQLVEWIVEKQFSLINTGGEIELFKDDSLVSVFRWTDPGADGVSWERTEPSSETLVPSVDHDGSTPGFANSVTPVDRDLSIDDVEARVEDGWTILEFTITNRGLLSLPASVLGVRRVADSSGGGTSSLHVRALSVGESTIATGTFDLAGMYDSLKAWLPPDDRTRNNLRVFTAPATDFPPFIMTEIQPRPSGGVLGEWVEIMNRHYQPYDLAGWRLGDCGEEELIGDTSVVLQPGQRLVLVHSADAFNVRYPDFDGLLIEPPSWPSLNDVGDTIGLADRFGLTADRFVYHLVFDDDYTWCRGEDDERMDNWGRSENAGGSPGRVNSVIFSDDALGLVVTVTPEVFSPDDDGYQDSVVITIDGPDTRQFELKVYDRQGRMVRRLDRESYRLDTYVWHGRSDGGARLPVGIYILYCEIEGVGSVKKPIVIAR